MMKSELLDLLEVASDAGVLSATGAILENFDAPTPGVQKHVDNATVEINKALEMVSEYLQAEAEADK
ncbi:MAG: hypothetical protein LKJ69_01600 [Lactobacillus sp.]|jgi:hypothetical protein|nr:hypothetical protein [Lactobacillus sp.]MCI2032078.1 hypothetical protein [Lactobacillus sp.]